MVRLLDSVADVRFNCFEYDIKIIQFDFGDFPMLGCLLRKQSTEGTISGWLFRIIIFIDKSSM